MQAGYVSAALWAGSLTTSLSQPCFFQTGSTDAFHSLLPRRYLQAKRSTCQRGRLRHDLHFNDSSLGGTGTDSEPIQG